MTSKTVAIIHASILSLALLTVISCKKRDITLPNLSPELPTLKRIDKDEHTHVDLEYRNKELTKLTQVEYLGAMDYAFIYNEQSKPTEAMLWGTYKYKFFYNGGQLTRLEYGNVSTPTVVEGFRTFTYENNRLKLQTNYYLYGNHYQENAKTVYSYCPNGDIKTITDSTLNSLPFRFVLEKRTEYEYDTMTNPLKAANEVFYALNLNPTPHNSTKETMYDENNQLAETRTYQYEYNSIDAPLKAIETITGPGRPTIVRTFTYNY